MRPRGFTLIELLVVISIISLLSSVVLASVNSAREKGRVGAARQFASQVEHVAGERAVGIWDFDECSGTTAADRSGSGATGTLTGGTAWSTDTPFGSGCSLSLDGVDDYVDLAAESAFDLANTTFTVSFWMKTSNLNGGGGYMFGKTVVGGGYGMYLVNGAVAFMIKNVTNNNGAYTAGPVASNLSNGLWRHVVAVVTTDTAVGANNALKVYVDGVLDPGSYGHGGIAYSTTDGNLQFGRRATGNFYAGLLDGFRVYDKGLTAAEVKALYVEGVSGRGMALNAVE